MGHYLITLLRGGIQADRIVYLIFCRIRHLLVAAIN